MRALRNPQASSAASTESNGNGTVVTVNARSLTLSTTSSSNNNSNNNSNNVKVATQKQTSERLDGKRDEAGDRQGKEGSDGELKGDLLVADAGSNGEFIFSVLDFSEGFVWNVDFLGGQG